MQRDTADYPSLADELAAFAAHRERVLGGKPIDPEGEPALTPEQFEGPQE